MADFSLDDVQLDGFRPEPENPNHWSFEDRLQPRLAAAPSLANASGDIDLRPFCSPVVNQRSTGSCVAQSVVNALEIKRIMEHGKDAHVDLSVLQVYYWARELMNPPETHRDAGTYISLACDVLRRFGVAPESEWPFDTAKVKANPTWKSKRAAYLHKIKSFYQIKGSGQDRLNAVISALDSGNPVVFGTAVSTDTWGVYRKGGDMSPLRVFPEDEIKGYHATTLVGYKGGLFIGENSWGTKWGHLGYYFMKPEVLTWEHTQDFWVLTGGWESYAE